MSNRKSIVAVEIFFLTHELIAHLHIFVPINCVIAGTK